MCVPKIDLNKLDFGGSEFPAPSVEVFRKSSCSPPLKICPVI